jgi:chromosome partitioning protein
LRADDSERADFAAFAETIARVEHNHEFVVIDTRCQTAIDAAGACDGRHPGHAPNDSFVDFDVLGTVDPQTYALTGTSHYAEMVREARRPPPRAWIRSPTDWVVVRNRLSTLGSRNKRLLAQGLNDLGCSSDSAPPRVLPSA